MVTDGPTVETRSLLMTDPFDHSYRLAINPKRLLAEQVDSGQGHTCGQSVTRHHALRLYSRSTKHFLVTLCKQHGGPRNSIGCRKVLNQ